MELDKGPVQILVRTLDLEIVIPGKMIHEKTQAELKADQPDRINEQLLVFWTEQIRCLTAVAFHNRSKSFFIKEDFFGIFNFLTGGVAAGTETVAEIMKQETRHNRVKINKTDCGIRITGKKKICDLGIAVDYA